MGDTCCDGDLKNAKTPAPGGDDPGRGHFLAQAVRCPSQTLVLFTRPSIDRYPLRPVEPLRHRHLDDGIPGHSSDGDGEA